MITRIYTTFPNNETAQNISKKLLTERLMACANILGQVQSLYLWDDELKEDTEVGCFYKTSPALKEKLEARLKELHPYECPCIISTNESVNIEYMQWVTNCLS